ncbi:uncharacterized protein YbjT (DUF2867 family) [Nocardia sp. GAS34]|uniref:NAD(P)H-binding protein n=1 Tax=unclassified Nocardia TaxID=2637762 RepID=UPI003D1A2D53
MIIITTPTGQIGSRLLEILLDEKPTPDAELRVIVRDPGKLPERVRARVDVVVGSHGDPGVVDRALSGADAVFWLVPGDPGAPSLDAVYSGFTRPAAKAFTARGVGHVVGVSSLGRGTPVAGRAGHVTASLAMDDLIGSTGVAYRALANPPFMDNLLWQVVSIRDDGVFTGTGIADLAAPIVATRDIAAAAADLLIDRTWTGADEVPVVGPEELSPEDMARIMSGVLGRPIRYVRQSLEDLRAGMSARGAGGAIVQGYVDMARAANEGLYDGVPRTPGSTGPTTFHEWCELVLAPAVRA